MYRYNLVLFVFNAVLFHGRIEMDEVPMAKSDSTSHNLHIEQCNDVEFRKL